MKTRNFDFESGEVLNINKPAGMTSFDVVREIRRHFRIKKVGHAGTLDPFATGVLLILTGKATKQFSKIMGMEKEYVAEIEFGAETDTLDIDGTVVFKDENLPEITREELEGVLRQFEGEIEQIPPVYSAIKYKGRRLYKYARAGVQIKPEPRLVQIKKIRLLDFDWPVIKLNVTCSKGTYIRALARDIGKAVGTRAYLRSLVRTRVGDYRLEDSIALDDLLRLGEYKTTDENIKADQ